jgi:hypothetical protein
MGDGGSRVCTGDIDLVKVFDKRPCLKWDEPLGLSQFGFVRIHFAFSLEEI